MKLLITSWLSSKTCIEAKISHIAKNIMGAFPKCPQWIIWPQWIVLLYWNQLIGTFLVSTYNNEVIHQTHSQCWHPSSIQIRGCKLLIAGFEILNCYSRRDIVHFYNNLKQHTHAWKQGFLVNEFQSLHRFRHVLNLFLNYVCT